MILAALHKVDKFYGEQTVLEGATLELRPATRTALIGRNGAGKSTVLRLLMGHDTPDGGTVYRRERVTLGMLEQDTLLDAEVSVAAAAERAFEELDALEGELEALERRGLDDPRVYEAWEELHGRFERRGGYERRARRDAVLAALGFRGRLDDPVARLSGGEKTRLGLGRLLMAQPDVLLLDEPTNHLDMDMRAWLEGFLSRYHGAALVVSHDRAFLDGACERTAEVARGQLRTFDGPPTRYRLQREEQERIEARTRANQLKEAERLSDAAAQMKQWAGQNAKLHRRAKSMERRLERYQADMLDAPEAAERTVRFRFPCDPSAEMVLTAEHLSKRVGPERRSLFHDVSLLLRQGDRVGLVGPNGAGKTTLLRLLLGDEPSDDPRGTVRTGVRVRLGYYDQELRGVDPERTLFEEVVRMVGDVEAHNLLGRFLFPFEAQFKRIADLSGGERARLALLKLSMANCNLLVLDEPTNHLDVEMIEALEAALLDFQGTLLLVSHDRRFLEATTTRIWEVREGRFTDYEGDFRRYERKRRQREAREAAAAEARASEASAERERRAAAERRQGPSRWQLARERDELEARIAELEGELAGVGEKLRAPEALSPDGIVELGARHAELEDELLAAMERWEQLEETLAG